MRPLHTAAIVHGSHDAEPGAHLPGPGQLRHPRSTAHNGTNHEDSFWQVGPLTANPLELLVSGDYSG